MKSPGDGAPDALGTSKRMISRTRWIGLPSQAVTISPTSIPACAEGPFGSRLTVAHHDALEFPDGQIVNPDHLCEGQEATVLQLPAQPATAAEADAQKRVAHVG